MVPSLSSLTTTCTLLFAGCYWVTLAKQNIIVCNVWRKERDYSNVWSNEKSAKFLDWALQSFKKVFKKNPAALRNLTQMWFLSYLRPNNFFLFLGDAIKCRRHTVFRLGPALSIPLKITENQSLSDVFRKYRKKTMTWNGLKDLLIKFKSALQYGLNVDILLPPLNVHDVLGSIFSDW